MGTHLNQLLVPTSRQQSISESILEADVYERRPQALKSPEEDDADKKRRKEAYLELALQMDQFAEMQESDYKQRRGIPWRIELLWCS